MLKSFSCSLAIVLGPLALVACGGGDSQSAGSGGGNGGGGGSGGAPFMSAPHAPLVMKDHGGEVLKTPALVTITFSDFDSTDYVQTFGDWLVTSDYFTSAMKEYGVGAGVHLKKVVLYDPPPGDDKELNALLQAHMANGALPSPADNPEAVYMVYYKKGQFKDGGSLCGYYDGYHSWDVFQGNRYVYAIIGECDGMINTVSHEFAEAATDPFNAWYIDGASDDPSHWVSDDELGDLCEYFPSVMVDGYPVARLYSNAAAKANQDPCLPLPAGGEVFKNVDPQPATIQTVARGQSTTFKLTGWSTAPTPPWKLIMDHATYYPNNKGAFKATATLSKNIVGNGETVELTVGVPTTAKPGELGMIGIYSDDHYAEELFVGVVAQ
jgi:hypothetical protein